MGDKPTAAEQRLIETGKRVAAEAKECGERLGKLQTFLDGGGAALAELSVPARARLEHQKYLMSELYRVLRLRVRDFPKPPKE